MRPLIVLACVISVFAQTEREFRKCCPKDHSLVGFTDDDVRFECFSRDSVEKNYNVSVAPLIVGDEAMVNYGMPEGCDRPLLSTFEAESDPTDLCYDRLVAELINGTAKTNIPKVVALTCARNETEGSKSKLMIDRIRKCCPFGQSYDTEYHLCRKIELDTSEQWLIGRLNLSSERIYEVDYGLQCKSDEYAVELQEDLYNLEVEDGGLQVASRKGGIDYIVPPGEWCMDRHFGGGLVGRICSRDCEKFGAYCVRKCCQVGYHYRPRRCGSPVSKCVPNEDEVLFNISNYLRPLQDYNSGIADVLGIRSDLRCPAGKVVLDNSSEKDRHELTEDGSLVSPISSGHGYCLEAFDSRHCPGGEVSVTAVTCFVKSPQTKDFHVSFVLISISSVCLALTLVVYCSLPELRNLHGKTLICHVGTMLLAFSCLARVQYANVPDTKICTMLGYGIYFGFVSAFAWLNVMCLDIWWTFGSIRTVQPMRKAGSDRRRFLWYSVYAWSISLLFTITTYLLDQYPVASFLDANIGHGMCWFGSIQNSSSDWPHYIFFVIPLGVVSCTNFVLWILTSRHCARVKSEVHRLQAGSVGDRAKKRFRVDRAKYILTGKLWVVMGAGWVAELLSTLASEPQWLWNIVDLVNTLQGVFIFLILVFKPKLYYLIRKRLGLEKPAPQKNGASSSARTSSTFLSRTISTDERTHLKIAQNTKQT